MNDFFEELLICAMILSGLAIIPLCFIGVDLGICALMLCIGCVAILTFKEKL